MEEVPGVACYCLCNSSICMSNKSEVFIID